MRKLHKILYMLLFGVALTSLTACGDILGMDVLRVNLGNA